MPVAPATTSVALHRDAKFRRLWAVGLLSSLVRWTEVLAFGVFTYQQTNSALWVASMMMLRMLPLALFGVAMGALAARISRRGALLASQGVLLATTLVLLLVSALGALQVWHLALASFISGAVWAGDIPMRRGFIGDVVGPSRMGQAMAFDAVANNGSRLIGPGAGGLLLAGGGMSAVFAVGAVLYVAVLVSLAGLPKKASVETEPGRTDGAWSMLVAGFRIARETPRLTATLCITVIFNIFCWPAISLVPVIGQDRLHLNPQAIGLLASMDGLGSLIGALALAALAQRLRQGHVYVASTALFLIMLPVFALSVHPLLSGAALAFIGAGQGGFAVMQSTLVFLSVPQERRMEAMGLLTMCIGIAPLGFVFIGWLAERLGAPSAAVVSAAAGMATLLLTRRIWQPCLEYAGSGGPKIS
jgi:MFS family permease